MIVIPNVICVAGVFAAGFGIWASVLFNNVTAMAAVANGLWPMRKVAESEARRRRALTLAADAPPPSRSSGQAAKVSVSSQPITEACSAAEREPGMANAVAADMSLV